ncbi:MAG TPA: SDR family oxidoreductase [Rhizomicrobium sp.]|jgi:3-oxoacyl-[acyl-carrier protein] reductase|nr:SDR family oxidoreductase [Rhizomicrobium sp.]
MEGRSLEGKVAIVTGSASGIGAASALGLAKRGAHVVVNYSKSQKEAEAVADSIRAAKADVLVVQGNVSRDEDCKKLAQAAQGKWGRIDILVNNAGTTKFAAHTDLDALGADDWQNIYATNVIGPFQMMRACVAALKASGDAAVVNVSSVAGVMGVGSSIAYAASKGALNTLTLSLARAFAPEIRVNAVCPGYVATPWFSGRFGEENSKRIADQTAEGNPLKRVANAEDIADTVMFLAGPESRNISGEMILVDSGMHLSMTGTKR